MAIPHRSRTLVIGLAVLSLVLIASPAAADPCDGPWCNGLGDGQDPPEGPPDDGGETQPVQGYAWWDFGLDEDDEGELCWYPEFLGYRPDPPPPENTRDHVYSAIDDWTGDEVGPTRCPGTEEVDLVGEAIEVWLSADPGAAAPTIDPGEAVTGLPAYLVLDGPDSVELSRDTPLGTLAIRGSVTYEIAWGDGTTVTTDSQGVPWPGGPGEITHVYEEADDVTVTVTSVWQGEWEAAGQSGALPVLRRPASLDLPVNELQAVRQR